MIGAMPDPLCRWCGCELTAQDTPSVGWKTGAEGTVEEFQDDRHKDVQICQVLLLRKLVERLDVSIPAMASILGRPYRENP